MRDEIGLPPAAIRHVVEALSDGAGEVDCEGYTLERLSLGEVRPAQKLYVLKVGDVVKVSTGRFGLGVGEGVRKLGEDSWITVINLRHCVWGVQGCIARTGASCAGCGGCSVGCYHSPGQAGRMLMSSKRAQNIVCVGDGPGAVERVLQESFAHGRCHVYRVKRRNEVAKNHDSLRRADESLCVAGCLAECGGGRCGICRTGDVLDLQAR